MKPKFTPGSWYFRKYEVGVCPASIKTDAKRKKNQHSVICDVYATAGEEGKANANLIMASKDLFNACVKFTENIDKWLKTGIPADKLESKDIYDNAKKAINKALGK